MDVKTAGTITGKIGVGTPGAILAGVFEASRIFRVHLRYHFDLEKWL